MIIEKNTEGWSYSTDEHKNLWHLVFDDEKNVGAYYLADQYTSTQANLFIGTKEECDQYISENELIYISQIEEEISTPIAIEEA